MSTKITEKYYLEVLNKLDKFKNAREWSDFIEPLNSLCSVFKKYNAGYVPLIPQIVKRLNQLLNPALPGGVHMKTIECYETIFNCLTLENLVKDFDILTIGLFNFSLSCRIVVANEYLDLLEKIIVRLGSKIEPFSKHLIFAFLPFMESESSEFYSRAYLILVSFLNQISERVFYNALWKNFIDQPGLRIPILNFLNKHKVIVIPEYNLVTNAFCVGLESDNPYITRSILDISNRCFPYTLETHENTSFIPNENISQETLQGLSDLSISQTTTSVKSKEEPNQETIVKDLTSERIKNPTDENKKEIDQEKEQCNALLIKGVLKIFLKREVGISKRAYKWLNISETILDYDMDYIEKGLKVYLEGGSDDILLFFRIINSLADRENLIVFLMDRLILNALHVLVKLDEKKDVENFYNIRKNAKSFLNLSLDEFYRVIYTKLDRLFLECEEITENKEESSSEFDIDTESTENQSVYTNLSNRSKNVGNAEQLLKLIVYCIESLDTVDSNAKTIHIPLLCHLVIRNKKKISRSLFSYFLIMFIERCGESSGTVVQEVTSSLINRFYQKENSKELLEIDLIASLAKELSRIEIYNHSDEDPIFWTDSNLILQNGVLVWSEMSGIYKIDRQKKSYFNFETSDIEVLQKFIEKYSFKSFNEDFLKILGKYLAHNYKFIDMINILSFYIDDSLIRVNLWNDFIVSKNPKFLIHFSEEFLLPFLIDILPTVCLSDICIFLKEGLKAGKYFEILFRVSTIIDQKQPEFVDLLLSIDDILSFLNYVLNKFYSDTQSDDPYRYNIVIAVNIIIGHMVNNENFMKEILENKSIVLDKFGEIGIREAITEMLFSIIIEQVNTESQKLGGFNPEHNQSIIFDYKSDLESINTEYVNTPLASEDTLGYKKIPYGSTESIRDSLRLSKESSVIKSKTRITRLVFNNLYKLKNQGVSINCPNLTEVKKVIEENKSDFYICKRSLFLVENDVEFIYKNFMTYYKSILKQISETNASEQFFNYIAWPNTKCTVEIMLEACKYTDNIKGFRNDEFFQKALCLMGERCQKSSAIYKKIRGFYRKIDRKLLLKSKCVEEEEKETQFSTTKFTFKSKLHETEILPLLENENLSRSLILLKCGDLESITKLASTLFKKNPVLFVSSMPLSDASLYLFGVLPFKVELFRKILHSLRSTKFPIAVFTIFSQLLSIETKTMIIRSDAEYIKNNFGFNELNTESIMLMLEFFKDQESSDLSRIIFGNILHSLEIKIEGNSKISQFTDKELKILEKIIKTPIKDTPIISQIKNCCFMLLGIKQYQCKSLELIFKYIKKNINCKIFIDAFIYHFNRNFFDFGILTKKKILHLLDSSTNFDSFSIVRSLMAGMETSFFMSAQSEEAIKIANLRRLSFLILSQPKNKFSSMSDSFVTMINTLVGSSFDKAEIKVETIRLCTVLMLKIDNHYLQTLFPILVADFVNTVQMTDLRNTRDSFKIIKEIFRFVDISIWLNSQIFDFRVLFLDGHSFYMKLRNEIFNDEAPDVDIDMKSSILPNFFTRVFDKITQWDQFSLYLQEAPEYYKYIEVHLIEKDYEAVEMNLIHSFDENQ